MLRFLLLFHFFVTLFSQNSISQNNSRFVSSSVLYSSHFVRDLENLMPSAKFVYNNETILIKEAGVDSYKVEFPQLFSANKVVVNGCKGNLCLELKIHQINFTDIFVDIKMTRNDITLLDQDIIATINTGFVLSPSLEEDDKGTPYHGYSYTASPAKDEFIYFTIGKCHKNLFCVKMERIGASNDLKNIAFEHSPLLKSVANP